jgi:release factor glutamine methyltransferase
MPLDSYGPLSEFIEDAIRLSDTLKLPVQKLKLLLSYTTGLSVPELILHPKRPVSLMEGIFWHDSIVRLIQNEPLQYILEQTEFYGLNLEVDENVLIPRPETEGLVEWIAKEERGNKSVLDIGTGSGAIALALKHLHPSYQVTATDISKAALQVAKSNAFNLKLDVRFVQADLFPSTRQQYDVIVSNPPYVSVREYEQLPAEVRFYEPRLALQAAQDGLEFYQRILRRAQRYLQPRGKIYFEIGETQAAAISKTAIRYGFKIAGLRQDLAGRDRYLCLSR